MAHRMKHILAKDVERAAQRLRADLGIEEQLRPNMIDVLQRMQDRGYISTYVRVPDDSLPATEVKFESSDRKLTLSESTYNALEYGDPRARLTLAYELGHIVLQHPAIRYSSSSNGMIEADNRRAEVAAQRFASAFLVPRDLAKNSSAQSAHQLANKFGIDVPTARKILDEMRPQGSTKDGRFQYELVRDELEKHHFGSYVVINMDTTEYVVAPTTTAALEKFVERFGKNAPGWCTRIGVSVFATA